jgi:hypothetical protein
VVDEEKGHSIVKTSNRKFIFLADP